MSPALLLFFALLLLEVAHRLVCDKPVRASFPAPALCSKSVSRAHLQGPGVRSWRACGCARQRLPQAQQRCRSRLHS